MRMVGELTTVQEIEKILKRRPHTVDHNGGNDGIYALWMGDKPSSVTKCRYNMNLPGHDVVVGLTMDKRTNNGVFTVRDDKLLILCGEIRPLIDKLKKLKPCHSHNKRNGNNHKRVEKNYKYIVDRINQLGGMA